MNSLVLIMLWGISYGVSTTYKHMDTTLTTS